MSEYLVDESNPLHERLEVFRYYGSFTKTLLTMFEAWSSQILRNSAGAFRQLGPALPRFGRQCERMVFCLLCHLSMLRRVRSACHV